MDHFPDEMRSLGQEGIESEEMDLLNELDRTGQP